MSGEFRQILGIRFYAGDLEGLLERTSDGGLITIPSAPVLVKLPTSEAHREALEGCDFAITDSGYMVLLWVLLKKERLPRISGLRFLRALVLRPEFRAAGATFWVMPSAADARTNVDWLNQQGVLVEAGASYVAPIYPEGALEDEVLLRAIEARRPRFVVLCIGGGVQERLGYFLRNRLSYRPAILCIGAAIAFLTGRQVRIPIWADRLMLGWLFRSLADPMTFVPRFWRSISLAKLLRKYGEKSTR